LTEPGLVHQAVARRYTHNLLFLLCNGLMVRGRRRSFDPAKTGNASLFAGEILWEQICPVARPSVWTAM